MIARCFMNWSWYILHSTVEANLPVFKYCSYDLRLVASGFVIDNFVHLYFITQGVHISIV